MSCLLWGLEDGPKGEVGQCGKKKCCLTFLNKILDSQNFTFAWENGLTSESREKVSIKKSKQNQNKKKTDINRGKIKGGTFR